MRVDTILAGSKWQLEVALDPEDDVRGLGQWDIPIELVATDCRVELPFASDPHPDLVGLAVLIVVRPWAKKRIHLNSPVSSQFSEAVSREFGIEMGPVDPAIAPRAAGRVARTGISLGPDCLAGDVLFDLPREAFYFVRVPHPAVPNRATHIRHDTVVQRLNEAIGRGWEIDFYRSDLEYMAARPFPTFAHWVTMFVGEILTADERDLGYMVSGRHIGGSYIHSGQRYDEEADHDLRLQGVFRAAGLDLVSSVAGLTEVGTAIIARDHELFDLSSSCLMSTQPIGGCGRCDKCFRKELVKAWVEQRPPSPEILRWGDENSAFRSKFERFETTPQPHTFAFLTTHLEGLNGSFLNGWVKRFDDAYEATTWVDHWFPDALEAWVPDVWRPLVREEITARVKMMNEVERQTVVNWPEALVSGPMTEQRPGNAGGAERRLRN